MTLAKDLLSQARMLAHHEPQRPRQASLRRAVSTAYYALFHRLVAAASQQLISGTGTEELRLRVARSFNHGEMKTLCRALARWDANNPPSPLAELLNQPPSQDLVTVANAFVELQQARHEADYDLSRRFVRSDVDFLVELASQAFECFQRLERHGNERRVFLIALSFHSRWKRV